MGESEVAADDERVEGDGEKIGGARAGWRVTEGGGLSTTSLFKLKRYGECGNAGMGCREGVVGIGDNGVVARRCRFRVTGDGDVENGINVSG
jgi:hypothetical protein